MKSSPDFAAQRLNELVQGSSLFFIKTTGFPCMPDNVMIQLKDIPDLPPQTHPGDAPERIQPDH
ncbi:hypothetical protein D3C81_1870780 [compost metagenome]